MIHKNETVCVTIRQMCQYQTSERSIKRRQKVKLGIPSDMGGASKSKT